jgi:hypothetical protein
MSELDDYKAAAEVEADTVDQAIRAFNRLEAAVTHHKNAHGSFAESADEQLWKVRDKILSDWHNGRA